MQRLEPMNVHAAAARTCTGVGVSQPCRATDRSRRASRPSALAANGAGGAAGSTAATCAASSAAAVKGASGAAAAAAVSTAGAAAAADDAEAAEAARGRVRFMAAQNDGDLRRDCKQRGNVKIYAMSTRRGFCAPGERGNTAHECAECVS